MENHNYENQTTVKLFTKEEIIDDSLSVSGPVSVVSDTPDKISDNCTNGTICKTNDDVICELVPVKEEPKRPTKAHIKCRKSYTLKEKLECLGNLGTFLKNQRNIFSKSRKDFIFQIIFTVMEKNNFGANINQLFRQRHFINGDVMKIGFVNLLQVGLGLMILKEIEVQNIW